jgi:hypothetical protein
MSTTVEKPDIAPIKPGDVVIDEITLRSYNGFKMSLKGIFHNITIYEDIFSNFMSGNITLIDSLNLVKNFPIIGAEVLTVSYRTPMYSSKPNRLVFRTYKLSLVTDTAQEATQLVKIEFISHNAIKSMQKKISKSFSSMPVSKMVESIYNDYLAKDPMEESGSLNSKIDTDVEKGNNTVFGGATKTMSVYGNSVDSQLELIRNDEQRGNGSSRTQKVPIKTVLETFDRRSYVIPYSTPFGAISWLCSRARAKEDPTMCDYVFYENYEGHHFVPLSWLKQFPAKCTYTKIPKGFRGSNDTRSIEAEMRNALTVSVENLSDKVEQQMNGMLASSMITHDLTTKTWNAFQYRYDSAFSSKGKHLEENPLVPNYKIDYTASVEACNSVSSRTTYTIPGTVSNNDPEEIALLRNSLFIQAKAINLMMECYGDSNLKVGDIIEYKPISKEATKMLDSYEDDYYKGRYMITAIKHRITDREHYMTMTVSRDSYAEPLAHKKNENMKIGS